MHARTTAPCTGSVISGACAGTAVALAAPMLPHARIPTTLLSSALLLAACAIEMPDELGAARFAALDPASCGDGIVDPGEICLQPPTLLTAVPAAVSVGAVEAGTFDLDPHADVAGAAGGGGEGRLRARHGDGAGGFPTWFNWTDPDTEYTDLAMFDMNGDGLQDMVIASRDDDAVHVRLSTGAVYGAPTVIAVGDAPERVHAGDLDGNGLGDFITLDVGANRFSVVRQLAPGVYGAPTTYPAYGSTNFALADCDNDSTLDLLHPVLAGSTARLVARRNHGAGVFDHPRTSGLYVPGDSQTRGIATGDLDGDGTLDAVVTATNSWAVAAVGHGDCRFSVTSRNQTWAWSFRPELADLDADGDLDLIAPHGNDPNNTISIKYGTGTGALSAGYDMYQSPVLDWANETATADLNGDGALDLVIASRNGIFTMMSEP